MPGRSRRNAPSSTSPASATEGRSGRNAASGRGNAARAAAIAAPETESKGLWGWFQEAGAWVGEKASSAATAVGDAVQGAADTAAELWDVATTSDLDVDWSKRQLTVETDLDELMDLVPARVAAALQLDRNAAENRVVAVYDHRAGKVTLTSDHIEVAGVHTERLRTGPVSLRGLRLVLTNPGGGMPGKMGGQDNLTADLTVAGLDASAVVFTGADGPVTVERLQLEGLTGQASDDKGDLGGEGTIAGFSVESAILDGLRARGVAVDRVQAKDLSAGVSEPGESATLAAGSVEATGASQGEQRLGAAQLTDARVDVQNAGGGLPFLDQKPDALKGKATATAASITDFSGANSRLSSASLSALGASYDGQTAALTASSGAASSLSTGGFSAGQLSGSGLSASLGPQGLSAGADRASLSGARVAGKVDVDSATVAGLRASSQNGDHQVRARSGAAQGVRHSDKVQAGKLGFDGLDARLSSDQQTVSTTRLRADALSLRDGDVTGGADFAEARGASARFGSDGVSGDVANLDAGGMRWADFAAERGQASGMGLRNQDGRTSLTGESLGLEGFSSPNLRAGRLDAVGGSASFDGQTMDAALDRVGAADLSIAGRLGVDAASASGLSASLRGNSRQVGAQDARFDGISDRVTGAGASSASLGDVSLGMQDDSVSAQAARLSATRISGLGGSAASLDAQGARITSTGDRATGNLDHASLTDARMGAGLRAGQAQLSGLSGVKQNGLPDLALTEAQVSDLGYTAAGTRASLGQGVATGAKARIGPQGVSGSLERLVAEDARASVAGGSSSGQSTVDKTRLMTTAAARVDDANLKANVPLNAGKYGALKVHPGTAVNARVGIQDGRFQPGATDARFSRPLGGPLWTSADGVYLNEKGEAKADVNGWFDKDVTGSLNESVGLRGSRVPDVATLGAAMAGGTGGSSAGPSMARLDQASGSGQVSFNGGTIDAGKAGSLTLANRQAAGDNSLDVAYSGRDGLNAQAERLRLEGAQAGGVDLGRTQVDDARVQVGKDGDLRASSDRIDARNLRFGR